MRLSLNHPSLRLLQTGEARCRVGFVLTEDCRISWQTLFLPHATELGDYFEFAAFGTFASGLLFAYLISCNKQFVYLHFNVNPVS
jgi:hypothetical protein